MLTRINKRLRQQEGFTLMELMIVVVILGILVAIAIPVYNGVQERARKAVGEANATMLNRGVRTLEALGYTTEEGLLLFAADETYDHDTTDHFNALMAYLSLEDEELDYVLWEPATKTKRGYYKADITATNFEIPDSGGPDD